MDDQERHAKGLEQRRAVLGNAHVDRALANTTPLTQEFQDLITRYAWGEIWTRPGLDIRSRRILVLGTCTLVVAGLFGASANAATIAATVRITSERTLRRSRSSDRDTSCECASPGRRPEVRTR